MAVALKATGTVAFGTASVIATDYPVSKAAGDLAILFCVSGNGALPAAPTGFTSVPDKMAIGSGGSDVSAIGGYYYYRFLDGTEGTSVDAPRMAGHTRAVILLFTGADTTTPITLSAAQSQTPASTANSTAAIAQKANDVNDYFIAFYGHDRDANNSATISSSSFTGLSGETITTHVNQFSNTAGGGGIILIGGDPASSSTGDVNHSATITSSIWVSYLLRINAQTASTLSASATLAATVGLTGSIVRRIVCSSSLAGTATMSASADIVTPVGATYEITATLAGTGTINGTIGTVMPITGTLLGDSAATATVNSIIPFGSFQEEMVVNGTFNTDASGWSTNGAPTVTINNGRVRIEATNGISQPAIYQAFSSIEGIKYRVRGELYPGTSPAVLRVGLSSAGSQFGEFEDEPVDFEFIANDNQTFISIRSSLTTIGTFAEFDNISIYPVSNSVLSADAFTIVGLSGNLVSNSTLDGSIVNVALASSLLSGAGTLASDITVTRLVTSTLNSTGDLEADADKLVPLSATLSGIGTISGNASLIANTDTLEATATLNGVASLDAAINNVIVLSASLAISSLVSGTIVNIIPAVSNINGNALLTSDAVKYIPLTGILTGTSDIIATANIVAGVQTYQVSATMAGNATAEATANSVIPLTKTLSSSGVLSGSIVATRLITAFIEGNGIVDADASLNGLQSVTANLVSTGTISGDIKRIAVVSSTITGSSDSTATVGIIMPLGSVLSGLGSTTSDARVFVPAQATMNAVGSLQSDINSIQTISALLAGTGLNTSSIFTIAQASATILGDGTCAANAQLRSINRPIRSAYWL